jgi:pimeloyl-ACP methyl ester carboxylesterase
MTVVTQQSTVRGILHHRTSRERPDQAYYLYVPRAFDGGPASRLLVTVHGHDREAVGRTEQFVELAERHNFVLLGPHFPPSIRFQMLGIGGERADLRLLDLVSEVSSELGLPREPFDLFGYSGGGQFAHRFLYVWPRRVRRVIVGAPGTVTAPSEQHRWPGGVRKLLSIAGASFDIDEIRRRQVMLLVGTDDVLLEGLNQQPWAMRSGATRLARARTLHASWLVAGIDHTYVEVPGLGHGVDARIVEHTRRFLTAAPLPTI